MAFNSELRAQAFDRALETLYHKNSALLIADLSSKDILEEVNTLTVGFEKILKGSYK